MQCSGMEGDQSHRDGAAEFLHKEQISFGASLSTILRMACLYSRSCTRSYLWLLMFVSTVRMRIRVMVRVRVRVRVTDL